jgi:hypothetical protein
LSLPNSKKYLDSVLEEAQQNTVQQGSGTSRLSSDFHPSLAVPQAMSKYVEKYQDLCERECDFENNIQYVPTSTLSCEALCSELAHSMKTYIEQVAGAYDKNPEQKSIMLLTLMEMWMSMDKCAIKTFPLLQDYDPGFPLEILDTLQLSYLSDMKRLQTLRLYLRHRHAESKSSRMTIFHEPSKGCFAERYYDESPNASNLKELHDRIEKVAQHKREEKTKEWKEQTEEYNKLLKKFSESKCVHYTDEDLVRIHHKHCSKCQLERSMAKMRIKIHEHPLPSNLVQAKSVVFELDCPKAFLDYREATWTLLGSFGAPNLLPSEALAHRLSAYSELSAFLKPGQSKEYGICFASTKKSHLYTHYSERRFPVSENDLFRLNGMEFCYFDDNLKVWPSRLFFKPSFAHHCELPLTRSSPLSPFIASMKLSINSNGPSSYQVVANQTHCPTGLNAHEFMGHLSLFSGKERRWLQILNELGSSNLNFSSETTTLLVSSLALQVGPSSSEEDHLGTVHNPLRDEAFCTRLIGQLRWRLEGISSNWREINCMETIITLLLQLHHLGNVRHQQASELLQKVRDVTMSWIEALRHEAQTVRDAETSDRCSKYALWAALLCRRTFSLYVNGNSNTLDPLALRTFLDCSVALQDNLVSDPVRLKGTLQRAVIRDAKMASRLRHILRQTVEDYPDTLIAFIFTIWPNIRDDPTAKLNPPRFLPGVENCWVEIKIQFPAIHAVQIIHVHLLEGHFLVMGQPLGSLSAVYRESVTVQALFGSQSLLTYPSYLTDMSHVLKLSPNRHQIHLGLRNGKVLVRAMFRGKLLELIPAKVFYSARSFDLPSPLINDCVHWLDLKSGILEIRHQPNIWYEKVSNWELNVKTKTALRRTVRLVDPQSSIFQDIANIFQGFEGPQHLTVFQPEFRPLSVELKRLGLSFTVNGRGWLESSQLKAEINSNRK